ncbi:hypothetical protein MNBD_GAMMA24-1823, partial [hydrothermal vent metagenome]
KRGLSPFLPFLRFVSQNNNKLVYENCITGENVNDVRTQGYYLMIVKQYFLQFIILFVCSTAAQAWTLKYDFNNGPIGQTADKKGPYQVFSDAAGLSVFDSCNNIQQDGQCLKMRIRAGDDGWGSWGGRIKFSERGVSNPAVGSEVWVSVKVFIPTSFNYTAKPRLKFLRLHTRSPGITNEGYNDLYIKPHGSSLWDGSKNNKAPFIYVKEQQNINYFVGKPMVDEPKLGTWENYEVYLKLDYRSVSNGGTSRARIWKNGKLLAELNNIQTLNSAKSYADSFLIFTYWNGTAPQDQYLYVDDLIVTTDTPLKRDAYGNPMIGNLVYQPKSPTALSVN